MKPQNKNKNSVLYLQRRARRARTVDKVDEQERIEMLAVDYVESV